MNNKLFITLGIAFILPFFFSKVTAQLYTTYNEELLSDTAIIVVTGMKINIEGGNHVLQDISVSEGATVKVSERNGTVREKKTEAFSKDFQSGKRFYSADFPVRIDSVYSISITYKNGTVINIDDFRLDNSWKTHFYFHGTTGSKSPASLLRKQMDEQSGLWCYVYSLFPLKNYKLSGGTQVK